MQRKLRYAVASGLMSVPALAAVPAAAQAQRAAAISAVAGSATDERGGRSNAVTIAPVLTLQAAQQTVFALGGTLTRFETAAWSAGGSGSVTARTESRAGAAVSLSGEVGMSRSSFGTTISMAEATPAVEWSAGTLTLFGGGRAALGHTETRAQASPQPMPVLTPGGTTLVTATRQSIGPVYGAQWKSLFGDAAGPAVLSYREEQAAVSGVTAVERRADVGLVVGSVSFGGSAGERAEPGERSQFASATVGVAMNGAWQLEASAGRYPSDRLTGAASGRYMSAGLTYRFGGADIGRLPVVRGVEPPLTGLTRLSIRATDAQMVEVYGDWNNWTPTRARRAANGVWFVDLPLAPGEYRYAFRVNEVEWRVPEGAVAADDGFGGRSAYVTVVRPAAQHGTSSREER